MTVTLTSPARHRRSVNRTTWMTTLAGGLMALGAVQAWSGFSSGTRLYAALGITDAVVGGLLYWVEVHRVDG
jgi:hypothetical protein